MKSSRTRVQEVCRANFVTFNKAELPRPWDSLGAVRAASGRNNFPTSERILRKVLCFLSFFFVNFWFGRGEFEETSKKHRVFLYFQALPFIFFFKMAISLPSEKNWKSRFADILGGMRRIG